MKDLTQKEKVTPSKGAEPPKEFNRGATRVWNKVRPHRGPKSTIAKAPSAEKWQDARPDLSKESTKGFKHDARMEWYNEKGYRKQ